MDKDSVRESILAPNILRNLKSCKKHRQNVTCLECGYVGMMGVKTTKSNFIISILFGVLVAAVFALFGIFSLLWTSLIIGVASALLSKTKYVLLCPNCERTITTR